LLAPVEDREKMQKLRKRKEYVEQQKHKWHQPPEIPNRRSCQERLEHLRMFVERRGGFMEDVELPDEVSFVLPDDFESVDSNLSIFERLELCRFVCETATVHIKGIPEQSRPAMAGRYYQIDLFSIDDGELDRITRSSRIVE